MPARTLNETEQEIAEKLSALEVRLTVIRGELANPPTTRSVYFFVDRESEARLLTFTIDFLRDLLK